MSFMTNSEMMRASGIPEPVPTAAVAAGAGVAGAAAGALAGAIAGPIGAIAGAVLGAVAGAAAGNTVEETRAAEEATTRRLDDEMGVTKGAIGAPMTTRESRTNAPSSVTAGALHQGYDDMTLTRDAE